MEPLSLVGVVGSLRSASINAQVLGAMIDEAPDDVTVRRLDISDVPLYNGDVEEAGHPAVDRLKAEVDGADGLVIVTPEYNMSTPAVTKNLIDWLSRPVLEGPINRQPVGLIAASPGRRGGAGAIDHLSQVLSTISPGFFATTLSVPSFRHRLEDDGRPDAELNGELSTWLAAFADFVREQQAAAG
jgi:chromate reductase